MLEKRRAYIEYISKSTIQITTPFRQKTFSIFDDCIIDLVSLKEVARGMSSPFYVIFTYDDEEDSYVSEVYAEIQKGKNGVIENFDFHVKAVNVRTTIWVDA